MPKLKENPIQQADVAEYLASADDFSFEMRVKNALSIRGFDCRHGGHYEDPVTKKSREFDIRAVRSWIVERTERKLRIAVECKNLRANFPLLVSCVRRNVGEDFHSIMYGMSHVKMCQAVANSSLYPSYEYTVKSTTQLGRTLDGNFSIGDVEIYEKWGQALASAHDLVRETSHDIGVSPMPLFGAVIPVLVVPDGMLWSASYDYEGVLQGAARPVERATCYVGKKYLVPMGEALQISHLEIVTARGLIELVDQVLPEHLFPDATIRNGLFNLGGLFVNM